MWRYVLGAYLLAHALVHVQVWNPKLVAADGPFDPGHSWMLGRMRMALPEMRRTGFALAVAAAGVLAAAGIMLLTGTEVWVPLAIAGSIVSAVLLAMFFNPWLTFGLALNAALVAGLLTGWVQDLVA